MKKNRVLVLAGGQSGEHEVSIRSACSVLQALPNDRFDVTAIVISREGRWLNAGDSQYALKLGVAPSSGECFLQQVEAVGDYDVVFPILHGPNGEDGTIQGMLKLAGIPCVGSGVLASAVCMDKVMTKMILASHGLARIDFFYVESSGELLLNEVNTMPGFTKTSMYPELWRSAGMNYADLVSRLVELAQARR